MTERERKNFLFFSEIGWEWMIHYCQRIVTGPRKVLTAGDALHQFVGLTGIIYGPLLGCVGGSGSDDSDVSHYTEELLRTCPHANEIARRIIFDGQFMPCHCSDKFCQVNQIFCRYVSAAYGFSLNYASITGCHYSVNKVIFLISTDLSF